jgi:long-chain acyl-CoA synthetase
MERIWLKRYPPGVPADIRHDEYPSVAALFEASAREHASRPAYHCMGRTITFAELDKLARDFAAWLQSRGVKKGDRVAIMLPNVLQYPVALFGALRAGATVVNVNPLYTARELEHQLKDSGAETIVILENFANVLQSCLGQTPVKNIAVASLGEMLGFKGSIVNFVVRHVKKMVPEFALPHAVRFDEALEDGAKRELKPVRTGLEDIAFLQYTGGTTGVSKGAMLLHRNILANLEQVAAWQKPFLGDQLAEQVIITALPLYHIFSLTANCLAFMKFGGCNVLITNPKDIPGFVKELGRHKFNVITGVNTLFNALLNHPDFAKLDFSNLRFAFGGGMAVQRAVAERWQQVTGVALLEGYGLTETAPVATTNPLDLKEYSGSIGLPVSSTELRFRAENGRWLPVWDGKRPVEECTGEIGIRGPQVMAGYWQRPEETAKVMTEDGFFMTGDIGYMDKEGFAYIVDRKKDMVLVSGFNVYPNEVEGVIAMHPGVLEVAVIGIPDAHSGEVVKAYIVKKDPTLGEKDVLAHCEKHLTGYKRPKHVEFRTELPKTNVGKILRRALRDEAVGATAGRKAA